MSKICVTVTAETTAELRRRRDAVGDADLVELRLDTVSDPDVEGALADRRLPVIITCRPEWEGGQFRGAEADRLRLLESALESGAEYVDVELRADRPDLVRRGGRRIVLSLHDFTGVPADLDDLVRQMMAAGPGVVKVAVTPARLTEGLPPAALVEAGHRTGQAYVWIAMGIRGVMSRILAARFGTCWTYAGAAVAPGQIPAERLTSVYRFRHLTAASGVFGVLGNPVGHSVSPAMHNAALGAEGIDAVYVPLEAVDVEDFERVAAALELQGASVTLPFKVPLFERLSRSTFREALDPLGRRVGAVNTLRRGPEGWEGRNTDVAGFLEPLRVRGGFEGLRAAVLGTGGAARAAAVALVSAGSDVTVHGRRLDRARAVAEAAGGRAAPLFPPAGSWDLLVNATPVGMAPSVQDTPWPNATFDGRLVYDLVYNPLETRLLREARAAGCDTIGGLDMLVAQAREQFEWWTGHRPSAGLMRTAALTALGLGPVAPPTKVTG